MRRDDPEALGHVITIIQKKARELDKSKKETFSHVHFMLEMLIAIRNNNVHRVSSIDYDHLDRMCRLASTCIRGEEFTLFFTFFLKSYNLKLLFNSFKTDSL